MRRSQFEAALSRAINAGLHRSSPHSRFDTIEPACRYDTDRGPVFVKTGEPQAHDRFAAEAAGLKALAATQTVRTPKVFAVGRWDAGAFIAIEWITLGAPTRSSEAVLGEQLAWQHRSTQAQFGWDRDNTIGMTPQPNAPCNDWVTFFREHRLRFQLDLAERNGAPRELLDRGQALCERLGAFFSTYRPRPSLLHGDLWSGNWGADADGSPVIFDPAVYYGDREADIAMTRLFGGFGNAFYAAYQSTWPLDPEFEVRCTLYNLYHVLNHFNLFGGGYLSQAQRMIDQLLAETGE